LGLYIVIHKWKLATAYIKGSAVNFKRKKQPKDTKFQDNELMRHQDAEGF